ncbi:HIRAN domain-containing protein [Sphingomonas sp. KC8]|uniref:HIRAN domain-containing protein n=1 Tax=Sphingomonas sp. KC8 TaxID=1030157 RepID=UPI0009FED372|nr:HIRAN domain-containing protein [Sphingomonas sp. KC8]ARS29054.1 hypothetical protein KC8_17430 [Sphingomonas sp. KC8]
MSKIYPVGVVGERNYQASIGRCRAGERVYICHEPDNPYDDMALKVETAGGETIGYIARSSWLRDAIHEQGRGATATIFNIAAGDTGLLGVVLHVTLTDDDIRERSYEAAPIEKAQNSGGLGGFVRRLLR